MCLLGSWKQGEFGWPQRPWEEVAMQRVLLAKSEGTTSARSPQEQGDARNMSGLGNCKLRKDVISVGGNMGQKYGKEVLESERSFMSSREGW